MTPEQIEQELDSIGQCGCPCCSDWHERTAALLQRLILCPPHTYRPSVEKSQHCDWCKQHFLHELHQSAPSPSSAPKCGKCGRDIIPITVHGVHVDEMECVCATQPSCATCKDTKHRMVYPPGFRSYLEACPGCAPSAEKGNAPASSAKQCVCGRNSPVCSHGFDLGLGWLPDVCNHYTDEGYFCAHPRACHEVAAPSSQQSGGER